MEDLTIGQLARKARVNVETVRYYERLGLIPEPPRRESGYRQFPRRRPSREYGSSSGPRSWGSPSRRSRGFSV